MLKAILIGAAMLAAGLAIGTCRAASQPAARTELPSSTYRRTIAEGAGRGRRRQP